MKPYRCNVERWGRIVLVLLLVASLTVILVHWHRDARSQECGLCQVHQTPSLLNSEDYVLAIPVIREAAAFIHEDPCADSTIVALLHGRAPPTASSSL